MFFSARDVATDVPVLLLNKPNSLFKMTSGLIRWVIPAVGGGGGVLPPMRCIAMCGSKGYGFLAVLV